MSTPDQLTGAALAAMLRDTGEAARHESLAVAAVTLCTFERAIDVATLDAVAHCGASVCILEPPVMPYGEALNRVYSAMRLTAPLAELAGITLAVRAPRAFSLQSPVEVRELLDRCDSGSVGVAVDLQHVHDAGDWLRLLERYVVAVRGSSQLIDAFAARVECPLIVDRD